MPVVAVVGALGAAAFAAADIAAVGLTVATAFEVVAAVGATVGAIGSVTGNKTMAMVGMGIGAVGAVGGIASAAGLFGEAGSAPLFGASPTAATQEAGGFAEGLTPATAGTAGGAIDSGAFDAGGMSVADAASNGTLDFMASAQGPTQPTSSDLTTLATTAQNETDPAVALASTDQPGLLGPGANAQPNPIPTATPDTSAGTSTAAAGAPPSTSTSTATPTTTETSGPFIDSGSFDVPGAAKTDTPGVLSSILKFAKDNPLVAYGALQTGGSFLSGLTNTQTPAQIAALNAQAAANQAAANQAKQQTANLAMPKAVAVSTPVTGTPQPLIPPMQVAAAPQMGGLINRPVLAPVTGAPV